MQNQLKTPPPSDKPRRRNRFEKVLGRLGPMWVVVFTAMATLLRWLTDGLLADSSPFSFYFLSVVLTALLAPMGSSILAVILGGLCGHFIWVVPRLSMVFMNTSQVAQLVVFGVVATLCAIAVTAARVLRVFDYLETDDD